MWPSPQVKWISKSKRVEKVEDYLKIGDRIDVKYMGIDPRTKKQKVSRKVLIEKPEKK